MTPSDIYNALVRKLGRPERYEGGVAHFAHDGVNFLNFEEGTGVILLRYEELHQDWMEDVLNNLFYRNMDEILGRINVYFEWDEDDGTGLMRLTLNSSMAEEGQTYRLSKSQPIQLTPIDGKFHLCFRTEPECLLLVKNERDGDWRSLCDFGE